MPHVLLIEDDALIRDRVIRALTQLGHVVDAVERGADGLSRVVESKPDVVVLDLGLPDIDGVDVLRMIRATSDVPVVVATARDEEQEIVRTLDAGADDHIVKPFSAAQLDARIRAVLRRSVSGGAVPVAEIRVGGLIVDARGRTARLDGVELELSRLEFDLLLALAQRVGEVVSRRELLVDVWRQPYGGADRTVDVHLSWLRRKLGETAAAPVYLHTVRGVGVKLVDPGHGVRRRLVAVTLATTTMIALAFVLPLAVLVRDIAEERAMTRGRQVAASLAPVLLTGDAGALEVALTGLDAGVPTTVVLPDGTRIGAPVPTTVDLGEAARGGASIQRADDADVLVTPVIRPDVGTWIVVVQVPVDLQRQGVGVAWAVLAGVAIVLVAGALVLADRLGRTVTRPAADLGATARRLAAGELDARVEVAGPPEVADVGRALNLLADRIAALVRSEREAVADMSHRLRTPMTALRLDVESLREGPERERLAADLDAVERSVDRLIRDARLGADAAGAAARADAADVVRERADWWGALADEQAREATVHIAADVAPVGVSRVDLTDALDGLLGNVFAHTPEGTSYRVELTRRAGEVHIAVHDAGPGLPPDVGQARGDSRSGSTGLGLDIARRVATAGGGRLEVGNPPRGARVVIVLPLLGPDVQGNAP